MVSDKAGRPKRSAANRGSQTRGSRSRNWLIEAAYDLLGEEGYHAFSARRVAEKARLKPQLVHYYFHSMEELVVAVFQHSTIKYQRLHDAALASRHPVRALWDLNRSLPEARRLTEYVALGKIYPGLREHMRQAGEGFRQTQIDAMEEIYARRAIERTTIGPRAIVLLMSAVARNFVIEGEVGLTVAHSEVHAMIEQLLDRFDPLETDNPDFSA